MEKDLKIVNLNKSFFMAVVIFNSSIESIVSEV